MEIDTDGDGRLSPTEQHAYARRVLRDLSITLNGERLAPRLDAVAFSTTEELADGRGDIHLEFSVAWPRVTPAGRPIVENRHQPAIAAYLANSLVPRDPAIRIETQARSAEQARYEVTFTRARSY
jgi:hypothetical protein